MKSPGLILHVMDMRRLRAAIGSLLFLFIAPGTLAGLVPWWLTGWAIHDWPQAYATPLRLAGAVLGVPVLLHAFARFVLEGIGTPAPVAPPTLAALDEETRKLLRALAEHSLDALGMREREPFLENEMLRLFGTIAATLEDGPDRERRLRIAIAAAMSEYD